MFNFKLRKNLLKYLLIIVLIGAIASTAGVGCWLSQISQNSKPAAAIQQANFKLPESKGKSSSQNEKNVVTKDQDNNHDSKSASVDQQSDVNPQDAVQPTFLGKKVAFLTFDDGPSRNTPKLLDILKQYGVKATFFVAALSEDTPQKRQWMKREVDEGHTIGIHSWSHNYKFIYSSENNFKYDFDKMRDMIVSATGVQPKFMRFPGGTDNTVSLKYNNGQPIMPILLRDVTDWGYIAVDWNAGGMDAVKHIPSKNTLANIIVSQCSKLNTAIILLHDSEPHQSSVDAVPIIIQRLRAMGFTFEPLTTSQEVVRHKPAIAYAKHK